MTIKAVSAFQRSIKRLSKKYRSLPDDVNRVVQELRSNPQTGKSIGHGCYKIRVAIASKGGGKSGGARIITYAQIVNETIFLLAIYDKSEQSSVSDHQVLTLLAQLDE